MKGKILKKVIAAALVLTLVTGGMPISPVSDMFGGVGIVANAETATSTINISGTDYSLFTGFTATDGTAVNNVFVYGNAVDGSTSTSWHPQSSNTFVEFNSDDPIIPKGYIFNTYMEGYFYPHAWVLKAKANATDDWTTLSSYSGQTLSSGQEFKYACNNDSNTPYKYFRFEASNTDNNIWLTEIRLYGSSPDVYYTHLTKKDATCTETGIKQDCYLRSDGKYFTDETGATELAESDVIAPIIPHTGEHHEATDVNIEYWQCSMCGKLFSNEGCTTEITEEDTKIYRTITIDNSISGLVTSNVNQALSGAIVKLTVSHLIDTSTLKVNNGAVELTDIGSNQYTFTVPADNVTVTAETLSTYSFSLPDNMEMVSATNEADGNGKYISGTVITFAPSLRYSASNVSDGTNTLEPDANGVYTVTIDNANINITATVVGSSTLYLPLATSDFTAADGETLVGSTSHTVTIANGANITLNNATINGGIVCNGSATITLAGSNTVNVIVYSKAGIQIGGSGTTLTINGDGSLTATGGSQAAGIGIGRTWDASVTAGAIVIEGGTVTASGSCGIGIGNVGNEKTASIDGISIKGGTVNASLGKGTINYGSTVTIGYIKIYDTIDMVDASKITDTVTYMHGDDDVTASKTDYFTISEVGDRRIITKKDDTDYTITIADGIENGTITAAATAKYMETVSVTATPAFGYRLSRLIVKDADNNDVATNGNTFLMPKGNVTVSAEFEQGTHGTTEFVWGYPVPGSFVNEATIYDGVTTVNIQQTEQSYNILKYDLKYDEYTYYHFKLDNDTYNADIPYAGGTGEFYEFDNPTNFTLNYDGETGYYDITMTDKGNGKWYVSFVKTAPQMDVVPDQTYTGSAITPEPTVVAGSLSLTKGTDYEYSYENNTDVCTATVTVTFKGDYESLGSVKKTFSIVRNIYLSDGIEHGTITPDSYFANEGETVTLTVTPDAHYQVKSVTVNGGAVAVTDNGNGTYSFTMPAGDVTVSAEFELQKHTVSISSENCQIIVRKITDNDSYGVVVHNGDKIEYGTKLIYDVAADYGYYLGNENGTIYTTKTYETTVNGDTAITAVGYAKNYRLSLYTYGGGGSPVIVGEYDYAPYNSYLTIRAGTPNEGYEFVGWYQTNGKFLSSDEEYNVKMTSGMSIRAQYRKTSGVVIFMANDQIQNEFSDAGYDYYYSSFVPSAKYGYEFTGWDKTLDEINTALTSGNVIVTANFAPKKETFTVTINNGEVDADETVSCEESTLITRTAKAVEGKNFAYWMKDDALFTYNPKISFTANADCVITAVYTSNTVTEQTTAEINKVSYVDGDLIIKAGMSVPDGMTIVSVGIRTSSNSDMSDAAETTSTASNNPAEFAVTKSGVAVNTTLYAQAYVTYKDTNNVETTINGNIMTITAGQDYDAAEKGTATIRSATYNADTKKATFNAYLTVPENAVIVKAGLVAAPSTSFNPESAVLTADYAAENSGFVKSLSTAEGKCVPVNYTWYKSNVNTGDTWYARAYLVYTLNGEQHTVYGSLVELKA